MAIGVDFQKGLSEKRAGHLSTLFRSHHIDSSPEKSTDRQIELFVTEDAIQLRCLDFDSKAWIEISFDSGANNHRRLYGGGKSQSLAKAVGLDKKKDLKILDATAGLAGDSFVMACLGAKVCMLERSPVLALMAQDALDLARERNSSNHDLSVILDRMQLIHTDAIEWLADWEDDFDVIYLDPMFPERSKKAAVKKEMQILQLLLEHSDQQGEWEEKQLLDIALQKARYRVVVKRPLHAPYMGEQDPGYSLKGKSTRFDIYPKKSMTPV